MSDPSVSPSLSAHDWLAIWVGAKRMMLPLQRVHAVFSAQNAPQDASIAPLEVEIHGGTPVFLSSLDELLTELAPAEPSQEASPESTSVQSLPWVVALRGSEEDVGAQALRGVRVEGIQGPLQAISQNGSVMWEGQAWPVVHALR